MVCRDSPQSSDIGLAVQNRSQYQLSGTNTGWEWPHHQQHTQSRAASCGARLCLWSEGGSQLSFADSGRIRRHTEASEWEASTIPLFVDWIVDVPPWPAFWKSPPRCMCRFSNETSGPLRVFVRQAWASWSARDPSTELISVDVKVHLHHVGLLFFVSRCCVCVCVGVCVRGKKGC